MFKRIILAVLCVYLFQPVFCAAAAPANPPKHVFVLSLDGGKPSVMLESEMPCLKARVEEAAVSWTAQTIFPSITLPSHTSMATGVGPDKHGVNWNSWKPENGQVKVPTMMALAKKAGFSTAMFAAKEKFVYLNTPDALDGLGIVEADAPIVAKVAAAYIQEKKPNLCFLHFADGDSKGHKFGWGSPEQKAAFAAADEGIKLLVDAIADAGITDESVFMVTADHGGHDKTHGSDSPEDMTIPWLAWGKGVKKGFSITDPITTFDTAATALWLLGVEIPAEWDGKPVTSAFE